jgi:hypothetical protein
MRLKGRIHATIPQGFREYGVVLTLVDVASGARLFEVEISREDWVNMTIANREVECEYVPRALHMVGKRREKKDVVLVLPAALEELRWKKDGEQKLEKAAQKIVTDLYGEGWQLGNVSDLTNPHKITGANSADSFSVRTHINRWVDIEQDEKE